MLSFLWPILHWHLTAIQTDFPSPPAAMGSVKYLQVVGSLPNSLVNDDLPGNSARISEQVLPLWSNHALSVFLHNDTHGNKPVMAIWLHLLSSELQMAWRTRWANGKLTHAGPGQQLFPLWTKGDTQVYLVGPDADCHLLTEWFSFPFNMQTDTKNWKCDGHQPCFFQAQMVGEPPIWFTSWTGNL